MRLKHLFSGLALLATALISPTSASTLTPPTLPLFVRNPYLSAWMGNARDVPWEKWPMFWTGHDLGFSVMAYLPQSGTVVPLLGRPQDSLDDSSDEYTIATADYVGSSFDASTTNLTYTLGSSSSPLKLTISFLSPITPMSTVRQAIPAAYMAVHVEGGAGTEVSVYVDSNGDWVTGDRTNTIEWELVANGTDGSGIKSWKMARQTEQLFVETEDRAEWGQFYLSAPTGALHQAGEGPLLRHQFAKFGNLTGKIDNQFRAVNDRDPICSFSYTFSASSGPTHIAESTRSAVFSIALIQGPIVQFAAARGLTQMTPLWMSYFGTTKALLQFHHDDFSTASALAANYSSQLAQDAYVAGGSHHGYVDIAALSARQVLGATQFGGTPDDPLIFLKEISSNGNTQTVDVIFPSFPFFLYTNPRWLAYLLQPLLEYQLSGQYPNDYSIHDLGTHFPNATGHADGDDEYMPVEECGNMIIMALALANALRSPTQQAPFMRASPVLSGSDLLKLPPQPSTTAAPENDMSSGISLSVDEFGMDTIPEAEPAVEARGWLSRNYKLWKQWTGYLVTESLVPANQLSTDDFAGWLANQTNLALKGIIGIRAMSEIATIVGEDSQGADSYDEADPANYLQTAEQYIDKWVEYGISRDGTHAKLAYTWYGSWTTLYNLYADALLCFHLSEDDGSQGVTNKTVKRVAASPNGRSQRLRFRGDVAGRQATLDEDINASADAPRKGFVPEKIYTMQSKWYAEVLQKYGLPLDSRHLYTKSDWEFFAAAVSSNETRGAILDNVALWVNETATDKPLTDLYLTEDDGGFPDPYFYARPVVGGHFAFLALERACDGKAIQGLEFVSNA